MKTGFSCAGAGQRPIYISFGSRGQLLPDPFRVCRVSPGNELVPDPYPAPKMRLRGTGKTVMDRYPALKSPGRAILAKEAEAKAKGMPYKELGVCLRADAR